MEETLDFSLVGILSALTGALAQGGISVFAVSTFDTDYLLVRAAHAAKALALLQQNGFDIKQGI